MEKLEAFILIGGRSSRLGTDKAFVELGGATLIEHAISNVAGGLPGAKLTMVAGSSTQFAIEAITSGVPFIFDLYEARGPLGGLHAALAYAKTPWVFVLACDYPFVSPELIRLLSEKIVAGFGAVVPEQNDRRLQPLCAFYNVAAARPIVEGILERPRVSPPIHEIVAMLDPFIVRFEDYEHLERAGELFLNINTAEDLDRARRRVRRDR
ncbi:MAG TPA: molybdenum cofactor guanylyltransferase [Pyrinomonadaceae bacterium]|nr:molybdenum cofactor guanylyltransferase [Pyrinomonadaceae bacterium]